VIFSIHFSFILNFCKNTVILFTLKKKSFYSVVLLHQKILLLQ